MVTLFLLCLSALPTFAATITVSGDCSLTEAVQNATDDAQTNSDCAAGDGDDQIKLTGDITLTGDVALADGDTLVTNTSLTINGGGYTLKGNESLLWVFALRNPDNTWTPITVTVNKLTVTNDNNTDAEFEMLIVNDFAALIINDSTFMNITSDTSGAALGMRAGGTGLTINNSLFHNISSNGGAIETAGNGDTVTITNSVFRDNTSVSETAVLLASSRITVNISGSTFSNNTAATLGGAIGICCNQANLNISNSVFSNNSATAATADGGAIYQNGLASIYRSVFHNNSAGDRGGAISSHRNLRLENSTFYDNRAVNEGGALDSDDFFTQTIDIRHVTFVNNESTGANKNGNSVFIDANITGNMYNSIIVQSSSATGTSCEGLTTNTKNIIQAGNSTTCATDSDLGSDPKLGSRRGGTLPYYPLQADSPARDAANAAACLATSPVENARVDQLGKSRSIGAACDIGAIEWYPPPPSPPGGGGGGGGGDDEAAARSAAMPGTVCADCPDLLAQGYRLKAHNGLDSGVQFRRVDRHAIGDQSLARSGFLDAIDVYGWAEQGVGVCFPASGSLLFLDAAFSPRAVVPLSGYTQDGMTCADFDRPGTLLLLAGAAPAARVSARALSHCMVTTDAVVYFREIPGGPRLHFVDPWGYPIAGWLPRGVTLTALERTADWFRVDYHGTRGWVSAGHVTPHGVCG